MSIVCLMSVLVRILQGERERDKETYYKELAHVTVEAEKSQNPQSASWRRRRAAGVNASTSPKAEQTAVHLKGLPLKFLLTRPFGSIQIDQILSKRTDIGRPMGIDGHKFTKTLIWKKCKEKELLKMFNTFRVQSHFQMHHQL